MKRTFVKEVFQGRETMGVGDFGIEGSDIISRHDVGRERREEKPYDLKEIVSYL